VVLNAVEQRLYAEMNAVTKSNMAAVSTGVAEAIWFVELQWIPVRSIGQMVCTF